MRTLFLCLIGSAALASAQDNPFSGFNKAAWTHVKMLVLRSAERMPEENYSFRPTDSVRSFGQILGHIADAQNMFCALATGEKNPALKVEESKSSKADLTAALKDAAARCDKAYDTLTDADAKDKVKLMGGDTPRPVVLTTNLLHTIEHYGNLVTYMRMKNVTPPSSDPGMPGAPKKK